ncbi:sulfatase-like hydrolase/transferase [Mycolicibacterium sp.]|uniref:sulfatase-like hydrolase/transferase n=1 Tax=Mycolicibacterium sp. TaxID=2320850 RepID=UPI001A205D09|nr:sulfatase-like hydrolase/transferase [Mycolicibacterium sp.]MBJ7338847.1 sulfatase-like hydrolase/transferase [Mycolicibacterium sp.]
MAIERDASGKPNILVIVVDQMRAPQWFPEPATLDAMLPNLAGLRRESVSFERHYTASNMCTPARGVMTTGLYSHQTGCLFTGDGATESTLAPRFPTWGTMLREAGYRTWWWGKWHLGHQGDTTPDGLDAHGFAGGTYPSPNGAPSEGLQRDSSIADQFGQWFGEHGDDGPWCTTVSLVNPHDIMWWPRSPLPEEAPHVFTERPPNFETPEDLRRRGKPRLQIDYAEFMGPLITGALPHTGPDVDRQWARGLDMYLWLHQQVDHQIGRVLQTLATRPEIERETVVVFTSDHGEYAGSHGLRGKGAGIYEEGIRVPLYIRDPSGRLTPKPGDVRTQLTSSVDLAPLLLTLGGDGSWRSDPRYAHLTERADLADIAKNPAARGRPWIAHLTDDTSVEEMAALFGSDQARKFLGIDVDSTHIPTSAPSHVLAVRTPTAKFGVYSYWRDGSMDLDASRPVEYELYDYATELGRREVDNQAGRSSRQAVLQALVDGEVLPEVHAPLPEYLRDAQEQGLANLVQVATARSG